MQTRDLLIEIGCEELPPKSLLNLSNAFAENICQLLADDADLVSGACDVFATPRRLAVLIHNLQAQQDDRELNRRGPAINAAFNKDGQSTPAALGFAKSCGVPFEQLQREKTDKGEWLSYTSRVAGKPVAELIPDIVRKALAVLPIAKRMRWGAGSAEFVRPVHWVVLLFGDEVIKTEIMGVQSDCFTYGHRFHHPKKIELKSPEKYEAELENTGCVIANFNERGKRIAKLIKQQVDQLGCKTVLHSPDSPAYQDYEDFINEITALNEYPQVLVGSFDARYLELPDEVLTATMQGHQRYIPTWSLEAIPRLQPKFIFISNIASRDPQQVIAGNERVVRPRLMDAEFFWKQDLQHPLAGQLPKLDTVIFQEQLGSLGDKTRRVTALAVEIAKLIDADVSATQRAAELSRCDLLSNMVGEFPELQGVMGGYYAQHHHEPPEVAEALREFYLPKFAGDELPASGCGQALAVADRLDTLVGIFGIGEPPTGEKDPYALRRAALGVLRILIEKKLPLDLLQLLALAGQQYQNQYDAVITPVFDFLQERLRGVILHEGENADEFEAVLATRPTQPLDFAARVQAVRKFRKLAEAQSLAAANKRIANILAKSAGGSVISENVTVALLQETAEKDLWQVLQTQQQQVAPLLAARDYAAALQQLAQMRAAVDAFFDGVMVMCEDTAVRANRLALLSQLRALFLRVADVSYLQS